MAGPQLGTPRPATCSSPLLKAVGCGSCRTWKSTTSTNSSSNLILNACRLLVVISLYAFMPLPLALERQNAACACPLECCESGRTRTLAFHRNPQHHIARTHRTARFAQTMHLCELMIHRCMQHEPQRNVGDSFGRNGGRYRSSLLGETDTGSCTRPIERNISGQGEGVFRECTQRHSYSHDARRDGQSERRIVSAST